MAQEIASESITVERPQAHIRGEVWGDRGSWVTLLNGHTRPYTDFRQLGRRLVSAGHRVLVLDHRGAGHTSESAPFALADMVGDVLAVLDAVGSAETDLLGISMGGMIALGVILAAPARIRRLALISTAAAQTAITEPSAGWSPDAAQVREKLAGYVSPDFARRNELLLAAMANQTATAVRLGPFADRAAAQRQALVGFNVRSRLESVQAPVLVAHGDLDGIIPLGEALEVCQSLERRGTKARLKVFQGAGHLLLAERPRELADEVVDFFGS